MQRFVQRSKSIVIFAGAAMAAACGTARTYAVPVAGAQMQSEYQPLMACASARNLEAHQVGDVVQVKVDALSWLEYGVDAQSNGYMSVRVDDKVQGSDLDAKVASSKKVGDDLMTCAQGGAPAANATASAPQGGGNAGPMNWSGNWMAKADYKWTCTVPMAKPEHGNDKSDWSMTISGQPTQLSAQVNMSPTGGFVAQGSGNDQSLRLCGSFPFKGKGGGTPNTRDNNVCVVVSEVMSANRVIGHAEGDFQTQFGIPCQLSDARIELTR